MAGDVSAVVVWMALALAGAVAVVILVSLFSSGDEESDDKAGGEPTGEDAPVAVQQLIVLNRIDRKLRALHVAAILTLVGWLFACLALAIGLALGPSVLVSDLLRRMLQ